MTKDKIKCAVCGGLTHSIELHLKEHHPSMSIERYKQRFPNEPLFSEYALSLVEERRKKLEQDVRSNLQANQGFLHEVFELKDGLSAAGLPIPITIFDKDLSEDYIPKINNSYIYDTQELKYVLSGFEANIPVYVWGHKGSGKTELFEQICARTNRPLLRVQHTVNTEESHIVGQWVVQNGSTEFQYGPLPLAMINGWTYLADEYDFALPNVLSVYQAVLEGKPLYIKEAPEDKRLVKPHPNFRFAATGNTNGTGDETGLYQGTSIQNSANYDRFGVVVRKRYLPYEAEVEMLVRQTNCSQEQAKALVDFATSIRQAFDENSISDTISPRALINAIRLGVMHGSLKHGIEIAYLNKLNNVDRLVCCEYLRRTFGFVYE